MALCPPRFAFADSGNVFYFALPPTVFGPSTANPDSGQSPYQLIVEHAGDDIASSVVSVDFLHGGAVYPIGTATVEFEQGGSTNYTPAVFELMPKIDDSGSPLYTQLQQDSFGGVQEGVFRITSTTAEVRALLYHAYGVYTQDPYDTASPCVSTDWWRPGPNDGLISNDVTRLFPVNNLGEEYTLNFDVLDRDESFGEPPSVVVVATRNDTRLTFGASPSMDRAGVPSAPEPVVLDRGQAWIITSEAYELLALSEPNPDLPGDFLVSERIGNNALNGMKISASKPVAVLASDACAASRGSACDATLAQLLPDRLLGRSYDIPLTPTEWMEGLDLRIVAAEPVDSLIVTVTTGTTVDGSCQTGTVTDGKFYEFLLADGSAQAPSLATGESWEVVWRPLARIADPSFDPERPGRDFANRRLTLMRSYGSENLQSEWEAFLGDSLTNVCAEGLFRDANLLQPTLHIESSAPISVVSVVHGRVQGSGFARLPGLRAGGPGRNTSSRGQNVVTEDGTGWVAPDGATLGLPVPGSDGSTVSPSASLKYAPQDPFTNCDFVWDADPCKLVTGDITPISDPSLGGNFSFRADPSIMPIVPRDRYQPNVSMTLPLFFSDCYVGDPGSFEFIGDFFCGWDVPFRHYALLIVPESYTNGQDGHVSFRSRVQTDHFGPNLPIADSVNADSINDWEHLDAINSALDYIDTECPNNNADGGYLSDALSGSELFPIVQRVTDWHPIALPSGVDLDDDTEYRSAVVAILPFPTDELTDGYYGNAASDGINDDWDRGIQDIVWGMPSSGIDALDGCPNNDVVGTYLPQTPSVMIEFALDDDLTDTFDEPDSADDVMMAYSLGLGWYGSYATPASIPAEDSPDDELILSDLIPAGPGNSYVPGSAEIELNDQTTIQLTERDTQSDDPNNNTIVVVDDGDSIELTVDLEPHAPVTDGHTVMLRYELELHDLESGLPRRVGDQYTIEEYTAGAQPDSAIREGGPTDVVVGSGPILLGVELDGTSPFHSPSTPVSFKSTLDFAGHGAERASISSAERFGAPSSVLSDVQVVTAAVPGPDGFRTGTILLDRDGTKVNDAFHASGTARLVFEADADVTWDSLLVSIGRPQPEDIGGSIDMTGGSVEIRARGAQSLAQLEQWRNGEGSPVAFTSLATYTDPAGSEELIADLAPAVAGTIEARVLEVEIELTAATATAGASPVIDALTAGFTPSTLVWELAVEAAGPDGSRGEVLIPLARVELGTPDLPIAPQNPAHELATSILAGDLAADSQDEEDNDYLIRASVVDSADGSELAVATALFDVRSPLNVEDALNANVSTRRSTYEPGEKLEIDSLIEHIGGSDTYTDLDVIIQIIPGSAPCDLSVTPIKAFTIRRIEQLSPGESDAALLEWRIPVTDAVPPGTYTVVQVVDDAVVTTPALLCNSTTFEVLESTDTPNGGFDGTLFITNETIGDGTDHGQVDPQFRAALRNVGNISLNGVELRVRVQYQGSDITTPQPTVMDGQIPSQFDPGDVLPEISFESWGTGGLVNQGSHVAYLEATSANHSGWVYVDSGFFTVVGSTGTPTTPRYLAVELRPSGSLEDSMLLFSQAEFGRINEIGQVVGASFTDSPSGALSTLWDTCPIARDLHAELGAQSGSASFATGISDDGLILGRFNDFASAFLFRPGFASVTDRVTQLLSSTGGASVLVSDINSLGGSSTIVGSNSSILGLPTNKAHLWYVDTISGPTHSGVVPSGLSSGGSVFESTLVGINDVGDAVGWQSEITTGITYSGLRVDPSANASLVNTSLTNLQLFDVSNPIGNGSQAVYVAGVYDDNGAKQPFRGQLDLVDVSTSFALETNGGTLHKPRGVSNSGTVVGQYRNSSSLFRGVLWKGTTLLELDDVVLNEHHGWDITDAFAVSDGSGQIAAQGTLGGPTVFRAVRLDPIPYPDSMLDKLRLWTRADVGVDLYSAPTVEWLDIIDDFASNFDSATSFTATTGAPALTWADCCSPGFLEFTSSNSDMLEATGITESTVGNPLVGDATFVCVIVPTDINAQLDHVVSLPTGTSPIDISIDGALLKVTRGTEELTLGNAYDGDPIMLILRSSEDSGDHTITAWRDRRAPLSMPISTTAPDWSSVRLGADSSATPVHGDVGIMEIMLFDGALTDDEIASIRDEVIVRHRIGAPAREEDLALWLRADQGVEPANAATVGVTTWRDQAGRWGDAVASSGNEPGYLPGAYGCVPTVTFDGTELLDGIGPADVYFIIDSSGSMDDDYRVDLFGAGIPVPEYHCPDCVTAGGDQDEWKYAYVQQAAIDLANRVLDAPGSTNRVSFIDFDASSTIVTFDESTVTCDGSLGFDNMARTNNEVMDSDQRFDYAMCDCNRVGGGTVYDPPLANLRCLLDNSFTYDVIPNLTGLPNAQDVYNQPDRRHIAVFLSDGEPNRTFDQLFGTGTDVWVISDDLEELREDGIPLHTIGLLTPTPNDPYDADDILKEMTDRAAPGGISSIVGDSGDLDETFFKLTDDLAALVEQATLSIVFAVDELPTTGGSPRALLETGTESVNGVNAWVDDLGDLHVGVWFEQTTGGVWYESISTPIEPDTGLHQLVITIDGTATTRRLAAYIDGVPFIDSGTCTDAFGQPATYCEASIDEIVTPTISFAGLTLGNATGGTTRIDNTGAQSVDGFVGSVAEVIAYTAKLEGDELAALFDWGIDRYGAGTLTRGYAPAAMAGSDRSGSAGAFDSDHNGYENVVLDASSTIDPDDRVEALGFTWLTDGAIIGSGRITEVRLPLGRHQIELVVTDPSGHVSRDKLQVDVNRVLQTLQPLELPFELGTGEALGDPLPATLADEGGSGVTASTVDGAASYQAGRYGASAYLTGGAHFDLGDQIDKLPSGTAPRTLSFWFQAGIAITTHDEPSLFVQEGIGPNETLAITANKRRVAFTVGEYTRGKHWVGPFLQLENGWHHVALVVPDGALWADQIRLYLNGSELSTVPLDGSGAPPPLFTGSERAYIGRSPALSSDPADFETQGGRIDEVKVFAGALRASEVLDVFNEVPVSAWAFESGNEFTVDASTAISASQNEVLVLQNGAAWISGSGILLDADSSAQTNGPVVAEDAYTWSIALSVKPGVIADEELVPVISDNDGPILLIGRVTIDAQLLPVIVHGPSLAASISDPAVEPFVIHAPDLFDGAWHKIAIVSDADDYLAFGDPAETHVYYQADSGSPTYSNDTLPDYTILRANRLRIGGQGADEAGFDGSIDDLYIFKRAISTTEFLELDSGF